MKAILYDWGGLNVWLFHLVNDVRNPVWDPVMLFGTAIGSHSLFPFYLSALVLVGLVTVVRTRTRCPAELDAVALRWMTVIAVFAVGYLVSGWLIGALKAGLNLPRPPAALPPGSVQILGEAEYRHSFPSGHAAFAMMVVASAWPVFNRPWKIVGIVFVAWVGTSRLAVGAHFPADVAGGYLLSLLIATGLHQGFGRLADRLSMPPGNNPMPPPKEESRSSAPSPSDSEPGPR
ncbi:MAG: phosphatase PAP2 family protein [Betaproteobacteria bacterium]|nr:phosphatase PAP2 family protein [Betaproteobacteria bacterium]